MHNKENFKHHVTALLAGFSLAIAAGTPAVNAAPGTLEQSPLFTDNAVPPNIFFLNDDSGSMAWEVLTRDIKNQGRFASSQPNPDAIIVKNLDQASLKALEDDVVHRSGCNYGSWAEYGYTLIFSTSQTDCDVAAEDEWRIRTHSFNSLYYNPDRTYEPWVDHNGIPLKQIDPRNALIDPSDPTKGSINLLEANKNYGYQKAWRYYDWKDDGDHLYEKGEEIVHWVTDLTKDKQINFANWFSYHRSRNYEAKYALSKTIAEARGARVGYGVLNNKEHRQPINDATDSHLKRIFETLFDTGNNGGTPLRLQLKAVGDYYKSGNFFGKKDDSPILSKEDGGTCQINTTILMTDGFYNDNDPNLGNVDGDNGAPFADPYMDTLADVAMYYYENDLSGLDNLVPTTPDDTAKHQHMNTYTISFGLKGNFDKTDIYQPNFSWLNPLGNNNTSQSDPAKIDDLLHAAVNGRGKFMSAQQPHQLVTALTAAVRNITGRVSGASRVAVSSSGLGVGSKLFATEFTPGAWTGELIAMVRGESGSFKEIWRASEQLARIENRQIISFNGTTGIPFLWGRLSTGQQDYLQNENVVKYLRGDRGQEGKGMRPRETLLGDIVNSGPVFAGAPAMLYPDIAPYGSSDNLYSAFWKNNKDRTPMVYVGANDGMLHGFNADTGKELLAYIPLSVTANLSSLSDPDYVHRYFADQTPAISDAFFSDDNHWRTVLINGLGAGGRGIFALDVTNPNSFNEANASNIVLWEFRDADDRQNEIGGQKNKPSDLGYTLARPVIALTNAKHNGNGPNRWAAIVGNGYNSDSGIAKLFVLFLDADPGDGWDYGDDYVEISTIDNNDAAKFAIDKNGLSSPTAVDSDSNGIMDRVYAGDLHGNLWAFDLGDTNPDNWKTANGDPTKPKPLFVAFNQAGERQAITAKPAVIHHPSQPKTDKNAPNLMVYFGTGQYLTKSDVSNHQTQTFYGVWDNGEGDKTRNKLKSQTIESGSVKTESGTVNARLTKDLYIGYDAEEPSFGWYIDLDSANASTGERVVANAAVRRDIVYFTTFTPSVDKCGQGGSSWFMFVRTDNGAPPPTELVDITRNQILDQDDRLKDIPASGVQVLHDGAQAGLGGVTFAGDEAILNKDDRLKLNPKIVQNGRRLSWRELRRR